MPTDRTAPRVIQPADEYGNVMFTEWGRGSDSLYYLTVRPRELVWRFWSVPVAGGAPRLVLAFDPAAKQLGGVSFATDDRRIFYTVMSDESDVWTLDVDTRR